MRNAYRWGSVVVAIVFLLVLMRIAHYENGAPPHQNIFLPGEMPATFYLPGASNQPGPDNPFFDAFPKPPGQRPPAVVLVHGYSSDRVFMSALARRIAQNGYGVLAIDVRGHGENRNSFLESRTYDGLREDVKNAVDFLRQSSRVDGSRIVVMGHSMGAGAVLDYATYDPGLKGAVMISGGFSLEGPERPRNALFIFAENDPSFLGDLSDLLAAHLAGVDKIERGKLYGDFAAGTAVESIQIPGLNHITIAWSQDAAGQIVQWLDGCFGIKHVAAPHLADPRLSLISICLALFILLLIPIGRVCAGLTTAWERRSADRIVWPGLAALAIALIVAMPLNQTAPQASFLSLYDGHIMTSWLAIAGAMLLVLIAVRYPYELRGLRNGLGATLFAAALAFGAILVIQGSYDVALHRTEFTPERLLIMLASAFLTLPFFLSFELILRRGSTINAAVIASIGRVIIVVAIVFGLMVGAIPFVLGLILPLFVVQFAMFEVFATAVYSVSGNLLLIAVVETIWFARTAALSWPVIFKF
ncbi:MAG TPA: alpha/beta fold hydrolase [Candidatus Binataceae bacterium]|nr:alpha/beta fold hydrolase [Candidatus Binataceae bacterium]